MVFKLVWNSDLLMENNICDTVGSVSPHARDVTYVSVRLKFVGHRQISNQTKRFALMIISFPSKCDAECKLIRKSYFSNFCVFLYESKDKLRAGRFHSASEYLNIF